MEPSISPGKMSGSGSPGTQRSSIYPKSGVPLWPNKLNNEQNFGVIANEPGRESDTIFLDGQVDD